MKQREEKEIVCPVITFSSDVRSNGSNISIDGKKVIGTYRKRSQNSSSVLAVSGFKLQEYRRHNYFCRLFVHILYFINTTQTIGLGQDNEIHNPRFLFNSLFERKCLTSMIISASFVVFPTIPLNKYVLSALKLYNQNTCTNTCKSHWICIV